MLLTEALADNSEIVVVQGKDIHPYTQALEGFKSECDFKITTFFVESKLKKNREVLKKIKSKKPVLVLTIGLNATLLVKDEIDDIPILYCMVMNPEKHGLIESGHSNISGITLKVPAKTQLAQLAEVIPNIKKIGVIYNENNTGLLIEEGRRFLKDKNIDLVFENISLKKSVPKAARRLVKKGVDALWLPPDQTIVTIDSCKFLILLSIENNIALMTYAGSFVQAGALLSLSPDYFAVGAQAGEIAKDIIHNNNFPKESVITPKVVNLDMNLKTAKKIKINITDDLINSAKNIFE